MLPLCTYRHTLLQCSPASALSQPLPTCLPGLMVRRCPMPCPRKSKLTLPSTQGSTSSVVPGGWCLSSVFAKVGNLIISRSDSILILFCKRLCHLKDVWHTSHQGLYRNVFLEAAFWVCGPKDDATRENSCQKLNELMKPQGYNCLQPWDYRCAAEPGSSAGCWTQALYHLPSSQDLAFQHLH